jgi:hypothetical protein
LTVWGFLFFLAAVAAIGLLAWNYRRKVQQREVLSKARFEEMFKNDYRGAPAPVTGTPALATSKPPAAAPVMPVAARQRTPFLTQPETLVYFLLRTAIPDHAIFAKVPLSLVIGRGGGQPGSRNESRHLSQHLLDFVVCDRNMHVVAVVEIVDTGNPDSAISGSVKADGLSAAGVRLAAVDASALPPRNEIRARVLGHPGRRLSATR